MGRTRFSMAVAALHLRRLGWRTVSIGYPSRRLPIEQLARRVAARLPEPRGGRVHFLTHSLGGIVVRAIARDVRPGRLGRAVMLGPPNAGSAVAGRLRGRLLFRHVFGPTGQQLAAGDDALPARLGPVDFEVGVIAGDLGLGPFGGWLDGPHDGFVTVAETRVEGMTDHIVMPRPHTTIMFSRAVIEQASHFLLHGRFRRGAAAQPERL